MGGLKSFKEDIINNYIANALAEGWIDTSKTKQELKKLLGEEPGVELKYTQESVLTEGSDGEKVVEKLESVIVYYTYDGGTNADGTVKYNYSKLEYII